MRMLKLIVNKRYLVGTKHPNLVYIVLYTLQGT
jgi:hypothetical protein